MSAVSLTATDEVERAPTAREAGSPIRGAAQARVDEDSRQREQLRYILLEFATCGATVNRDAIDFARGIAEILIWSADHALRAAEAKAPASGHEVDYWGARVGRAGAGQF